MDRTVELAAVHCPADSRLFGGAFSTVVRVEPELLLERGAAAEAVHGISNEEICSTKFTHLEAIFLTALVLSETDTPKNRRTERLACFSGVRDLAD